MTIHQPQFIPYLGFFNKVRRADLYVILDDVKATKNDFTNRNKLRSPQGAAHITIPVRSKNEQINRITVSGRDWVENHLKTFQHFYGRSPYYTSFSEALSKLYRAQDWKMLTEIDIAFLLWIFDILEIRVRTVKSSDLHTRGASTIRLVELCKALDANVYVSGPGGRAYLDLDAFQREHIQVVFQNFVHPVYEQRFKPFIPNLSILDSLFDCGSERVKSMIADSGSCHEAAN